MLLGEQTSIGVVAMVVEAEGEEVRSYFYCYKEVMGREGGRRMVRACLGKTLATLGRGADLFLALF